MFYDPDPDFGYADGIVVAGGAHGREAELPRIYVAGGVVPAEVRHVPAALLPTPCFAWWPPEPNTWQPRCAPPAVSTQAATEIEGESARLHGTLVEIGAWVAVDVFFQWRETGADVWNETPPVQRLATGAFSAVVEGLSPDTAYEFRAVAAYGPDSDRVFGDTLGFSTLDNALQLSVAWEFEDEGYLLFDESGTAQHDGTKREYSDPETEPNGSPWSFLGDSDLDLRLAFEDDNNCGLNAPDPGVGDDPNDDHSGNFNPNGQTGRAVCTVTASRDVKAIVEWEGFGEQEDPQNPPDPVDDPAEWDRIESEEADVFEEMRLFVQHVPDPQNPPASGDGKDAVNGEILIGRAIGPGGNLNCADMAPVITDPRLPGEFEFVQGEEYRIRIWASTIDEYYHFGAYYQFTLKFEEQS